MSDEETKNPEPAAANPDAGDTGSPAVTVNPVALDEILPPVDGAKGGGMPNGANLDLVMDVAVPVTVCIGSVRKTIAEILTLTDGQVIDIGRTAGEPVDLLVNGKLIARGEVVVVDDNYGLKVTELV